MKKLLCFVSIVSIMLFSVNAFGQCFNAADGQYPSNDFVLPNCDGSTIHSIAIDCYASDYSGVEIVAGNTYTFSSSIPTDFITISNQGGTAAYAFGLSQVLYTATATETVRFYSHADAVCTENNTDRERRVVCSASGPCFNANAGQYPTSDFDVPNCDGSTVHSIALDCYSEDYSAVNVIAGNTYIFSSSITSDWITIANSTGTVAYGIGLNSVIFTAGANELIRFYSHTDANCTEDQQQRERNVVCASGAGGVAGPCTNAPGAMYPTQEYDVLNCSGAPNVIATDCYAGEYSKVAIVGGHTYGFESSVPTDWITITDSAGTTVFGYGQTPLNGFVASGGPGGIVRFYTHTDSLCGVEAVDRSRIVTCIGNVGLNEIQESDISLFPNPSSDKISIVGKTTFDKMELITIEGRVLKTIKPTGVSTEIDVNDLVQGTYFVRILSNGQVFTKEFIKN